MIAFSDLSLRSRRFLILGTFFGVCTTGLMFLVTNTAISEGSVSCSVTETVTRVSKSGVYTRVFGTCHKFVNTVELERSRENAPALGAAYTCTGRIVRQFESESTTDVYEKTCSRT